MWASALLRPCLLVPRGLARRGLGLGGPAPLAAARGLFNNTAANATPATPATSHATHSHAGHGATSSAGLNSRHLSHSSSCSAGAGSSSGRGADDATYTTTTTTAATAATATANRNDAGTISDAEWAEVVELLGAMAATKGRPNAPGGWRDAYEYMPVHLQVCVCASNARCYAGQQLISLVGFLWLLMRCSDVSGVPPAFAAMVD